MYVTYDDEGAKHFHINDDEVDEQVWMQRHPMMKEDKGNGRNSISGDGGRVGEGSVSTDQSDAKVRRGQGLRAQRAKAKGAQGVNDHLEADDAGIGGAGQGQDAVG